LERGDYVAVLTKIKNAVGDFNSVMITDSLSLSEGSLRD